MAVLFFVPGILYLTQPRAMTRLAVFVPKTTKSLDCRMEKPSLQGISWCSMSLQLEPNLLLGLNYVGPQKMTSCYFQAILGVFLHLSGARRYGEALHCFAVAGAGRWAFAFVQRDLCWCRQCSSPNALDGWRCACAAHNSCDARVLHLQLSGQPQWPRRHQWCVDMEINLLLEYPAEENQLCKYLLTQKK